MRILISLLLLQATQVLAAPPKQAKPAIRLLLPSWAYGERFEKAFSHLVDEYNLTRPDGGVQLVRRGEEFSSLKEIMAMHLAGSTPEIAAIEAGEVAAIENAKLAQSISKLKGVTRPAKSISIPFVQTFPVLFVNQERLFRVHQNPEKLPTNWKELIALAQLLAEKSETEADHYAMALPLQGNRGLWVFEALAGIPLWKRELGGIRANRDLQGPIESLQKLLDNPKIAKTEQALEKAVQDFVDRKTPLLIGSLDLIPTVAEKAGFRWTAGRLPKINGGMSDLEGGSHLVVTRDSPEIWDFLEFVYSSKTAPRWVAAGALVPLRQEWVRSTVWAQSKQSFGVYSKLLRAVKTRSPRTTDTDVIRLRSSWIQAMHFLFGENQQRLPIKSVLSQLDSHLTPR